MLDIKDSEGFLLSSYDRVMVCDAQGKESSKLWRHDIFLDYDDKKFPQTPYLCAGGFWPVAIKIE